jgi:quercetin dioxygenase-like cupin family protein
MRPVLVSRSLAYLATVALVSCSEGGGTPTAPGGASRPVAPQAALAAEDLVPFTARAPLDPYFINQAPELMLRSKVTADLAIQRLVTAPSEGAWHTHPGPSFAIVAQGQVMITRYSSKDGCTEEVYGPGETYYEVAGEVHRATVLPPDIAVEYKVRFNTPAGDPFATPAADPGC